MKKLRVGITVGCAPDGVSALWSNGIQQNVIFLALLLQRLPIVEWAGVVQMPSTPEPHGAAETFGIPNITIEDAVERLDVLIELGGRFDPSHMAKLRARGGKLVSYMAGNTMVMNFESVANNSGAGEILAHHRGFDAVWITPQHWLMNASYCRLTRSSVVEQAPHIWHPCILENLRRHFDAVESKWPLKSWRIGVFEPTLNVVKTFHMPALVCEEAFRRNPSTIDRILFFGVAGIKSNVHFREFFETLDISKTGRVFAEERHPLCDVLGKHVDAVVTHQWENALNYLYWDTLYLGYPLVHNAPSIKDAGFYYPDFDPQTGGEVLAAAVDRYAAETEHYRRRAQDAVWTHHADNPQNALRYTELLQQVMDIRAA